MRPPTRPSPRSRPRPSAWSCSLLLLLSCALTALICLTDAHGARSPLGLLRAHVLWPLFNSDATKAGLPRYNGDGAPLPLAVTVHSLPRSTARREYVAGLLAGTAFSHVDSVDGEADALPLSELMQWFGRGRRLALGGLDDARCAASRAHCRPGTTTHARAKIATDLTYVRGLQRLLSNTSVDAMLFLEDDAVLSPAGGGAFVAAVAAGLLALPNDWEVWTLWSPPSRPPGRPAGPTVSVLRSGFGTVGWVVRRSAVPAVLALLADTLSYDYVDLCVFGFAAQTGALRVYVSTADPRVFHAGFPTTIVR